MRYAYLALAFLVVATVSILGFRGETSRKPPLEVFPDMDRMPKYMPQSESAFFADGRTDRHPPEGTVARGAYRDDPYLATGREGEGFGDGFPIEVTSVAMERGRENYNVYCAVCHGQAGDSDSMTRKYGMLAVADLTAARFVDYPDGQIYDVIVNGKNTMMGYADKLDVEERWEVVLYLRALQRAANGKPEDLTAAQREELGL